MDGWGEVGLAFSFLTLSFPKEQSAMSSLRSPGPYYQVYLPDTAEYCVEPAGKSGYLYGTYHEQIQRLQLPLPGHHGIPPTFPGFGTIAFDTQQELLWVGSISVRFAPYSEHHKYSNCFRVGSLRSMALISRNTSLYRRIPCKKAL